MQAFGTVKLFVAVHVAAVILALTVCDLQFINCNSAPISVLRKPFNGSMFGKRAVSVGQSTLPSSFDDNLARIKHRTFDFQQAATRPSYLKRDSMPSASESIIASTTSSDVLVSQFRTFAKLVNQYNELFSLTYNECVLHSQEFEVSPGDQNFSKMICELVGQFYENLTSK